MWPDDDKSYCQLWNRVPLASAFRSHSSFANCESGAKAAFEFGLNCKYGAKKKRFLKGISMNGMESI